MASGEAVSEVSVAEVDVDNARRVSVKRTPTRERGRETSMERNFKDVVTMKLCGLNLAKVFAILKSQ